MITQTKKYQYYIDTIFQSEARPTLLMLHGFMGCGASFSHLGSKLQTFSNPLFLDLLGHGESEKIHDPEAYSSENQIRDLFDIITQLPDKPVLHGYSMGGRLALQYAISHPDTICGLILESTTAGIRNSADRKKRQKSDLKRADDIISDFENFLKLWNQNSLFGDQYNPERSMTEAFQEGQDPGSMASTLKGFGTGVMPSVWDTLDEINLPALLIAGADDHKFATLMMEMDTLLQQSRLTVIPNAAHRVHLDQPEMYIDAIRDFFTQHFTI